MARKRVRKRPTCSKHGRAARVGKSAAARTKGARGLNACRWHPAKYKVKANAGTSVRVVSNRQKGDGIYRYRALKVAVDGPSGFRTYEILTDPHYNLGGGSYTDVWRDIPEPESVQQAIYDAVRAKRGSGRSTKRNGPRRSSRARPATRARRSAATRRRTRRNASKITHGFRKGDRVQSHPATDAWMMGDRYGDVSSVTATKVRVKMDRSGRIRTFAPHNVLPAD